MTSLPKTIPTIVRPNYQGVYDYRITNSGLKVFRTDRTVLEITIAEFAEWIGWDFTDALWYLSDPDEDFSYYCSRISDFISYLEDSKQETI